MFSRVGEMEGWVGSSIIDHGADGNGVKMSGTKTVKFLLLLFNSELYERSLASDGFAAHVF